VYVSKLVVLTPLVETGVSQFPPRSSTCHSLA
jgi:hypothetical protein